MIETDITESTEPSRLRFRYVAASIIGLWACYFLLITARGAVGGLGVGGDLLLRRSVVCAVGIAITFVIYLIMRLFDGRPTWMKIVVALVVSLPGALAIAQFNELVFAQVTERMQQEFAEKRGVALRRDESGNLLVDIPQPPGWTLEEGAEAEDDPKITLTLDDGHDGAGRWLTLVDAALSRYFLLLAWSALYLALLAGAQARAAERRAGIFHSAAKAAELRSLRYQVNPHFLFNTFNSLSSLVMTGRTKQAEEMIQTMSGFYRHSLTDDLTADATLADEFELQRKYLAIEAIRFPKRLRTEFILPDHLREAHVPGMILQPLIENSVKYGVAPVSRPVTIRIEAREEYGRLVLTVSDDGPSVPEGVEHGFGIGLANVSDRLQARFGKEASIVSGPTPEGYATILRVPLVP